MPNRILRENILSSEAVCSLDWPAEVFYRRLHSIVDDYGRYEASPRLLRARCFPLQVDKVREADISRWLVACQTAGLILLYTVESKQYLEVTKFKQQQRTPSKYPPPLMITNDSNCSANAHLGVSVSGVVSEDVFDTPSASEESETVPHAEFQKAWNELGSPFSQVSTWNAKRQTTLRARWADKHFRENWRKALAMLKQSPFCRGSGPRGWIADVTFFLRPDTVASLLEGKYSERKPGFGAGRNVASSHELFDQLAAKQAEREAKAKEFVREQTGGNQVPT